MNKILKLTIVFLLFTVSAYAFDVPTANYSDDAYTELLIHGDQADGTAGTSILDSSHNNRTITAVGDAQVDTAYYKDLTGSTGSILFDGTGDYLTLDDSDDFNFGTGDWTVDFWMRIPENTSGAHVFFGIGDGVGTNYVNWQWNGTTTNTLYVYGGGTGTMNCNAAFAPSKDTWYHIAFVRSGDTCLMYVDGTSLSVTGDFTGVTFPDLAYVEIGSDTTTAAGSDEFYGWIDELRISKGIARDWLPTDTGDVMIIQYVKKYINNMNPDKIGTPMWSCKIKIMAWWKNLNC